MRRGLPAWRRAARPLGARRLAQLLVLAAPGLGACAADAGRPEARGVANFERPPGMPIGTGAGDDSPAAAASALLEEPSDPSDDARLDIPAFRAGASSVAAVPCSGCVELNVDVSDINQRDEFAFAADGAHVRRVVWTIRVNFNSDQLAVQPFVDAERGKYTALHVNTFPLGEAVQVEQELPAKAARKAAQAVGLIVGSSGAWTGNQTMSVFVDEVRIEGPEPSVCGFDDSAQGLAPRTDLYHPKVVPHPLP